MIDPTRMAELDGVLGRAAETVPAKLYTFYAGCTAKGFQAQQALQLTIAFLQAVLAVPSEPELPKPGGE